LERDCVSNHERFITRTFHQDAKRCRVACAKRQRICFATRAGAIVAIAIAEHPLIYIAKT
jgi:hypothetical protein